MRWFTFFLLAYFAVGFQTGVARAASVHGAAPNLVLLAVVFIAMNAPRQAALGGAIFLGALQDLTTQGTMGLYAFSYGLVGLFIVAAQQAVYREHPLTQFSITLIAGIITAMVLAIHGWIRPPDIGRPLDPGEVATVLSAPVLPLFYSALYSAILAPIFIGILQKSSRVFRFQSARRRGGANYR
jgi:rod shape-determining protein MreD